MGRATRIGKTAVLAAALAASMVVFASPGRSPAPGTPSAAAQAPGQVPTHKTSPYRPGTPDSARDYFQSVWGVNNLLVRETASGNLIRFSYRVTDPARAKALGDQKAAPYLIGQRSRAMLQVPVMDKVGKLRQGGPPVAGKEYWMVFSNKGNLVRAGDRVNVIIGSFRADGLTVE